MANWAVLNVHGEIAELHHNKDSAQDSAGYTWASEVIQLRVWHRVGDTVRHNGKCELKEPEPDSDDWELREPLDFDK